MKLSELAAVLSLSPPMEGEAEISSLTEDSRDLSPGALFAAIPGSRADGRDFAAEAARRGAAAVLWPLDQKLPLPPKDLPVPVLEAPASGFRSLVSRAAREIYGRPDEKLKVVGLTGTNGKSTVSYLLEAMLSRSGQKPGVIGTVNYRFGGFGREAPNTTPEGPLLYRTLSQWAAKGATHAVMEISSHALSLGRVRDLRVEAALFTNLTRDHLDFHGSMEDYYQAKRALFFENLADKNKAAVCLEDDYGQRLFGELGQSPLSYGFDSPAKIRAEEMVLDRSGAGFLAVTPKGSFRVKSPLLGSFNVLNSLGAIALGQILGLDDQAMAEALASCQGAPGRLQKAGGDYLALIDYAHTPSALAAAMESLKALRPKNLIVVFGCGGDRDKGKRPLMGREAARISDLPILTSDNPRGEDPMAIIEEAAAGLKELGLKPVSGESLEGGGGQGGLKGELSAGSLAGSFVIEPDRRKAIRLAAKIMGKDDLLLIAGKGHEAYQLAKGVKTRFDDAEEAILALKAEGKLK
ncbi:MAG: UDP-N-acetylmuramoyl-L-alanyl-D-glutamate--2,6-diaminopimelate ligase [Deltaproteobacteria bacterium]|nr:UDP-N-acetylmuramoyl-L-alanyl-D-glutamate--2,6-diaminopimelate ligase [Deltaproteobacteria bacterium]